MSTSKKEHSEKESEKLEILLIEGSEYLTRYTKKYPPARLWTRNNEKEVLAFIPGTIQKIHIKPGQKVDIGEALLVLEAMKMRNIVKSPLQGIIKSIHVKEGDMVPKNFLIVEFK